MEKIKLKVSNLHQLEDLLFQAKKITQELKDKIDEINDWKPEIQNENKIKEMLYSE